MNISKSDLLNILGQEKLRIELALIFSHQNVIKAAEIVDMSERNFYRKLHDYGLMDKKKNKNEGIPNIKSEGTKK